MLLFTLLFLHGPSHGDDQGDPRRALMRLQFSSGAQNLSCSHSLSRQHNSNNLVIMEQLASPSRKDILGDIDEALDQIQASGSFASFAGIPSLGVGDQLGLFVHGVGHISLPLQDAQARQLIAQSRQAPYGKDSDTIVDTSVRNTWELDTSQFEFRNAAWAKTVDRCVSHAGKALGITAETPIKAEPYKMLIYEAGAMFKAHTESDLPLSRSTNCWN